jgi:hypothetical protein
MGMVPVPAPGKELTAELEKGAKSLFAQLQRLLRLSAEQQKQATLIEKQTAEIKAQAEEIAALRDELHVLRAREELVLVRAEAAATLAASHSVADLARRIGHLEARQRD